MPIITPHLTAAAILALTAASAHAHDGETRPPGTPSLATHAVPAIWCRPSSTAKAYPYRTGLPDVANTRGMTAMALRVFLTTSHSKMPNLIFTPDEIADVSAYILSLRGRPRY